ncbi:hypothetical protein BB561_002859 [Smittium simulii]|uniref:Autophagy-related protein 16 domain-containing protein n=1 Tax=Smittium simulii TaxID=133385 RepID=A0A2T9YNV2_9FUNG|nr:hypothetical protein BB561_002859 [Smittium simulii]
MAEILDKELHDPKPWLEWELHTLFSLRERDLAIENISQISSSCKPPSIRFTKLYIYILLYESDRFEYFLDSALAKKISQYAEHIKKLEKTEQVHSFNSMSSSKLNQDVSPHVRSTLAQQRILELEKKVDELNKERGELYKTQSLNTQKLLEISEKTQINLKLIKKQEQDLVVLLYRKVDMEAEIRIRTQKIQDQTETIGEKNKTIEILQDEVAALQLELVHLEVKVAKLWEENQQLVQRWLKKMNEEADIINTLNQKDEEIRRNSLSTIPFNVNSNFLNSSENVLITIPSSVTYRINTKLSEIHSISVSPHKGLVAVGGDNTEVLLIDYESSQKKSKLSGCTNSVFDVTFNSFGSLLAAACSDNSIYIWNVDSKSLTKVLTGHIGRVVAIKFNQDSTKIISCSIDRTIKVWDIQSGNCLKTLFTISNCNDFGLLDNEGATIITGHMDFGIRTWNTITGVKLKETKINNSAIVSIAVSQSE